MQKGRQAWRPARKDRMDTRAGRGDSKATAGCGWDKSRPSRPGLVLRLKRHRVNVGGGGSCPKAFMLWHRDALRADVVTLTPAGETSDGAADRYLSQWALGLGRTEPQVALGLGRTEPTVQFLLVQVVGRLALSRKQRSMDEGLWSVDRSVHRECAALPPRAG